MKILSLSEAKMKLSELVETVNSTQTRVMITRNGRPAAILISPDEFESWKETVAIRYDMAMTAEIQAGLAAIKEKKARLYTLAELLDEDERP
jgi:antitoxin YefM